MYLYRQTTTARATANLHPGTESEEPMSTTNSGRTSQALGLPHAGDIRHAMTTPAAWGLEDAHQGRDRNGGAYFTPGGRKWREYNAGYDAGLALQ